MNESIFNALHMNWSFINIYNITNMRLTLKRFINLLSEKHLSVNVTSLVLLTSNQSITWTHLKLHYVNALMKIHNNYYSLQPFIFYEVAYKLSPEYVLYIVKLCQTRSSNLLTAKGFRLFPILEHSRRAPKIM